jgi:hypothetical protein
MRAPTKAASTLAGFALVLAAGLTGCGGDGGGDGMPSDASVEDFCANFDALDSDLADMGDDPDPQEAIKTLKEAGDDIEDTGTPEDASDDEREGLQVTLDTIDDIDDDASLDDISKMDDDVSDADQKKMDAFSDYLDKTCED